MNSSVNPRDRFFDLAQGFKTAMLVSHTAEKRMHARPMAVAKFQNDGSVYFMTSMEAPKIEEMKADPEVTITFQGKADYAAARGMAEISQDRDMIAKLWSDAWKVWFPKGKDDPSLCILKVSLLSGEYWDNSGAEGIKYLYQAAKALASGTRPQLDQDIHGKVQI